jgi:hypothetical protein
MVDHESVAFDVVVDVVASVVAAGVAAEVVAGAVAVAAAGVVVAVVVAVVVVVVVVVVDDDDDVAVVDSDDGKDVAENRQIEKWTRRKNPVDVPDALTCTVDLEVGVAQDNQWCAGHVAPEGQSANGADNWMADRYHDQSPAPSDVAGVGRHSDGSQGCAYVLDRDEGDVNTWKDTID